MIDIPKNINIAGKVIQIEINREYCAIHKVYGICLFDQNKIILDDYKNGHISKTVIEQTLIHEILHFINAIIKKNDTICDHEDYIGPVSELLFQIIPQLKTNVS